MKNGVLRKSVDTNQKAFLIHALLSVGCLPYALQLLSLHPEISGPYLSISEGIHRLLHVAIRSVYIPFSPLTSFGHDAMGQLKSQRKRAAPSRTFPGTLEWLDELERKSVRGYSPVPKQEFGDRQVRFFLDEEMWANDVPICESMDDFYAIVLNLLRFSGPRLGHDVSLLVKLARIGKGQLVKVASFLYSCS